jgi:Spy/CpxP family protein refolding chaperone
VVSAWKAILAAVVIFFAGAATGGLVARLRQDRSHLHPPVAVTIAGPVMRMEFLKRIEKQLNLTPTQREHIEGLLRDSQERMKTLWEPIAPKARAEFDQVRERILAELTPAQQSKFEELSRQRGPHGRDVPGARPPRKPGRPAGPWHNGDTNKSADHPPLPAP